MPAGAVTPGAPGAVAGAVGASIGAGEVAPEAGEAAPEAGEAAPEAGEAAPEAGFVGGVWPNDVSASVAEHKVTVSSVFISLGIGLVYRPEGW